MKIVVLDGQTLNPGDLSWERLDQFGECEVYENSTPEEVITRAGDAEIVITNKVVLDEQIIANLPALKYIGVTATGYNVVDTTAAGKRNIPVTNVPTYGTRSVAQMVFVLLLELTQRAGYHSETVRQGKWSKCPDFCYWDFPLIELADLTMGIVGFGRIGKAAAALAKAFGMKLLVYEVNADQLAGVQEEVVDIDTLFSRSDVISLHCPLTPDTENLVNAERLTKMKNSAFLINTSRGQLVNDKDLADALNSGQIAGAGLDVLSIEPPKQDNPLLKADNCIITPHIAWATISSRARLMNTAIDNAKAFIDGRPENVVN